MITFLDENDVEYGALATIKATNAVNGERSLTGTIVSGDYVLSNIERGWRLRFDDEYYVVTYAKPVDEGRDVQVTFDAVHQFFWDFDKSSVYDQLSDGSHTFVAYLDFIFKNSGYSYTVDSALNVYAFEKESFGLKSRLTLFNDVITSTGVEFQVNGKVVRVLEKVGTDLSTVVRKNFNMNELTIEKNIGDFVTYQKGYGAYFDEEDHSKGRLEVEYTSTLTSVYGKLEAEPLVDERYTQSSSLLAALKANVDNSYTISVSLDMEDLTRAGYKYTQPIAGDYIMAINETLDFQEKIRIVSFTSEYDVQGNLVKHEVTCNDIGTAKKLTASYNTTKRQVSTASINATRAYSIANRALVSADGKNTNYYGNSFPQDTPKGTLKTGDLLFLTVGDTVKQYYWNGAEWLINPVVSDVEAFKEQIAEELKDVPDREEFEATIAQELATSKAEIETQIDTAKTQAESNAKAYADEINQVTAEVAEQANTTANSLKSDLAKVKTDLTATTSTANAAKTSASEAKQQLTTVANDLNKAKQDLTSQASQLTAQASAQTELTKRVSTVEKTANGTKSTVSELNKTVDGNTKDIASVTARTKTVEDDLLSTKTTLSQVQTTADDASQKTAVLETGLNGVKADLAETTSTADATKTNLASYQASNDKAVANLQSNIQTVTGDISSLQTKVEAVPGQITSAVSAVEGKIPTEIGGRNLWIQSKATGGFVEEILPDNHVTGQKKCYRIPNNKELGFDIEPDFSNRLYRKVTFSAWVKYENVVQGTNNWNKFNCFKHIMVRKNSSTGATTSTDYITLENFTGTSDWKYITYTYDYAANKSYDQLKTRIRFNLEGVESGNAWVTGVKIEVGSIPSDYSPAPEDTESDITKLNTTLTQTANGLEQLSTQVTSQGNTITSHTSSINSLTTGLSAKVSQTDFNTLSGRVTTAENNITAKANELSSKISSVEGLIPTNVSTRNLILKSNDLANPHKQSGANTTVTSTDDYFVIKSTGYTVNTWGGMSWNMSISEVKAGEEFSILMPVYIDSSINLDSDVFFQLKNHPKNLTAYSYLIPKTQKDKWFNVAITFKITRDVVFDTYPFYVYLVKNGLVRIKPPMLVRGSLIPSDYQPAPEDYDSKLATAQSEIKQTTDAISASVSALDKSTVKSASLTIGSDGIVLEAGKSPTDVVYAIGSYFSVNQNAINLFSDKINVKANMIVDGAITSTKIASKSINTAHLNGKIITADVIATNAITADAIKAGAITTNKMTANSINGDRITAGTLDAAKIKAGSITASQIASGTITSSQIKASTITSANIATGAITTNKIAASSIDASKIAANTITSNHISTAGITADKIIGGTLTATNGAMKIGLTSGRLEFYTEAAFIRRVLTNYPNQFISFRTGTYDGVSSGVTVIGSNRNGDENSNNGAFAGVRIWNGWNSSTAIDNIDLVGDTIKLVHSAASDSPKGWIFYNWNNGGSPLLRLYGTTAGQRAGSYIEAGDIHIMKSDGTYMSLKSILNTFNDNFSSNGGRYYINGI